MDKNTFGELTSCLRHAYHPATPHTILSESAWFLSRIKHNKAVYSKYQDEEISLLLDAFKLLLKYKRLMRVTNSNVRAVGLPRADYFHTFAIGQHASSNEFIEGSIPQPDQLFFSIIWVMRIAISGIYMRDCQPRRRALVSRHFPRVINTMRYECFITEFNDIASFIDDAGLFERREQVTNISAMSRWVYSAAWPSKIIEMRDLITTLYIADGFYIASKRHLRRFLII